MILALPLSLLALAIVALSSLVAAPRH